MIGLEAPLDDAGVAAAIQTAAAGREPLFVTGNSSKSAMLRPVQAARTLSTRNLQGVTLYSPTELVLSARAGTTLVAIEQTLAERGQHLIAEPPNLSTLLGTSDPATLGGAVAANLSGPRRIAQGAMRDHILGMRAVNGEGTEIRSGGRVLKNVTGLDLCKLIAGSHGTLAVMTEITLKVLPAPECTGTIAFLGVDATTGVAVLSAALGSPYGVSGAAYLPDEAAVSIPALARISEPPGIALVRIEDFAPSVTYRIERLATDLARFGIARLVEDASSQCVWKAIRDAQPLSARPEDAVWRVSVRPSEGPAVVAVAEALNARWFLDWGGGLVWIAARATAAIHQQITDAATAVGGVWMLIRAPDTLRTAVPVLPPLSPVLARLTKRVKAAFDPVGILNPGRMYAGI